MNNTIALYMHKSSRKNALTTDFFNVHHLISKEKITDERILSQFVNTIETVVHNSKKFNNHLELTAYLNTSRDLEYQAVTGMYTTEVRTVYNFKRQKFSSLEECINFIHSLYLLIYPDTKIHLNTIHNDSSIKYFINQYYHG